MIASLRSFECCWGDISQHLKVNLILENCPREFAGKYNEQERKPVWVRYFRSLKCVIMIAHKNLKVLGGV